MIDCNSLEKAQKLCTFNNYHKMLNYRNNSNKRTDKFRIYDKERNHSQ